MLTTKQKKAVMLLVRGDMTQKEIARELKITEATIINWKKKQEFKDAVIDEEREVLKGLTPKAIKTMEKLLDARSELVRYNVASDILDRTGHKAKNKDEIELITPNFINDIPLED